MFRSEQRGTGRCFSCFQNSQPQVTPRLQGPDLSPFNAAEYDEAVQPRLDSRRPSQALDRTIFGNRPSTPRKLLKVTLVVANSSMIRALNRFGSSLRLSMADHARAPSLCVLPRYCAVASAAV